MKKIGIMAVFGIKNPLKIFVFFLLSAYYKNFEILWQNLEFFFFF